MIHKLEKIINSYDLSEKRNINNIIHDDIYLFNYDDINNIDKLKGLYTKLLNIFKNSFNNLKNKITHIKNIKNKFRNKEDNNYQHKSIHKDLFWEIESIIAFLDLIFTPNTKLVMVYNKKFHEDKMIFSYLFSCFDKIAHLIYYYFSENYDENERIYFTRTTKYFDKIPDKYSKIKDFINKIIKLNSFKTIKFSRNKLEHNSKNPWLKYNFSCDIMICSILLFELIIKLDIELNKK